MDALNWAGLSRVLDQRGRLLMAAVGFAGCSLPSYDRALHALRTGLDLWGVSHVAPGRSPQRWAPPESG